MKLWKNLAGVCLLAIVFTALAQPYPAKPIRVLVAFAPGGGIDIIARSVAPQLQAALGQPLVVENRPSAGGIVAAEATVRSAPDGYLLLITGNDTIFQKLLYKKLSYDPQRDLIPVGMLARAPIALFVHESVPARTLQEFVAYTRANAGKLNYGSAGVGHPFHLAMELFAQRTGASLVHVPYKGMAPVIQDLVAGRIQAMFYPATSQMTGYMKEGRLRALAAVAPQRLAALPETPTFDEAGVPDFNAAGWIALFAPAGTPREIVERLNREIGRAVASREMAEVYAKLAMLPGPMSLDEFARFYNREFDAWAGVTRSLGIVLD
jgi:tripartite-type tricarboxylate transporter receptor subunit TctC